MTFRKNIYSSDFATRSRNARNFNTPLDVEISSHQIFPCYRHETRDNVSSLFPSVSFLPRMYMHVSRKVSFNLTGRNLAIWSRPFSLARVTLVPSSRFQVAWLTWSCADIYSRLGLYSLKHVPFLCCREIAALVMCMRVFLTYILNFWWL